MKASPTLPRLALAAGLAVMLSGCMMFSTDRPYTYVSKTELGLNVPAITDPVVRARAEEAMPAIRDTLLALGNSTLDQKEVEARLGWTGATPLLLPPEWRFNDGRPLMEGMKRQPAANMGARNWASPDEHTLTLIVSFSDGLKPVLVVRELQTYRRIDGVWRLVRQQRFA